MRICQQKHEGLVLKVLIFDVHKIIALSLFDDLVWW